MRIAVPGLTIDVLGKRMQLDPASKLGATIEISNEFAREYICDLCPPPEWYKRFNSAPYTVHPGLGGLTLVPVVGRIVYTFDTLGEFIDSARDTHISLFGRDLLTDTNMTVYRVRRTLPGVHTLYRLPPIWD